MKGRVASIGRWSVYALAAVSLLLVFPTIVGWCRGSGSPLLWSVGPVELHFDGDDVTAHPVSRDEQAWRKTAVIRGKIERLQQEQGAEIYEDLQRDGWGTPAYEAALSRLHAWNAAREAYWRTQPAPDAFARNDLTARSILVVLGECAIPMIASVLWYWQRHPPIKRWLGKGPGVRRYRRMTVGQRALNICSFIAAGVSMMLALGTIGLWVRSYSEADLYSRVIDLGLVGHPEFVSREIATYRGGIGFFERYFRQLPAPTTQQAILRMYPYLHRESARGSRGWQHVPSVASAAIPQRPVDYRSRAFPDGTFDRSVTFRYWLVVLLLALLPVMYGAAIIRRKPIVEPRECDECGYNLTGNTSGVCPECGNPVPAGAG